MDRLTRPRHSTLSAAVISAILSACSSSNAHQLSSDTAGTSDRSPAGDVTSDWVGGEPNVAEADSDALVAADLGTTDRASDTQLDIAENDEGSSDSPTEEVLDISSEPDFVPTNAEDIPVEALDSNPATACPGSYRESAPTEGQNGDYSIGGQVRSFYLDLPPDSFEGARPLLVGFHGTSGTGQRDFGRWSLDDFVAAGFIVVNLDGEANGAIWPVWDAMRLPGTEGDPNPDLAFFDSIVSCTAAHHPVDANRIYIVGHSAGGIMVNAVLQRRSGLLAGGVSASGIFEFTSPEPAAPLDDVAVLITWGGDDDFYSGTAAGSVEVPAVGFAEQAAIASRFYDNQTRVSQFHCEGNDLGHAWLRRINPWIIDFLLAHPKGLAENPAWELTPPVTPTVTCRDTVAGFTPYLSVECAPSSDAPSCQDYCQFWSDCVVENGTAGPVFSPQLYELGFRLTEGRECNGCVDRCEADADGDRAADDTVLSCFVEAFESATCGLGIGGAMPMVTAFNRCCDSQTSSLICTRACETLESNDISGSFFPACAAWLSD